jgi:dipeptidyl aminopeptidase/acylaminoacyl peptidase
VLLLLHGSYSQPLDVLPEWLDVAQREGVILAAPKSFDYGWRIRDDPPALMRDIVDDVAKRQFVDRRRLYLFGHSAGAIHALMLGLLESQYFAAVAVHAGAWKERGYFKVIAAARRKIPLWLTIGDHDEYFSLQEATATQAALREAGFPMTFTVIKGHDHSYSAVAPVVNRTAWEFLQPIQLTGPPLFELYN